MRKLSTKQIALTSIFAGFYYLFSFLPGIPTPGVGTLKIQIEACFATVFGCILGPFLGAIATFLGVFVAWVLPPGNMAPTGLLFLPSPIINAVVSGLLIQRRWKSAVTILGLLIIIFLLTPPIQPISEFWNVGVAVVWDKIIALFLIGPLIVLEKHASQRSTIKENQNLPETSRSRLVPLLFLTSTLLIFGNSLIVAITGARVQFQYIGLKISFGYKAIIEALGVFNYVWVVMGIVSIFASIILLFRPEKQRLCVITIIICSLVSVFTGGGFIIGVIIAVVTGFFAFFEGVIYFQSLTRVDILQLFIIAFIGNEADNIWGSLIFAIPFVYTTFFGFDVQTVRFSFLISPFAYPAIRFLQAIIATAVAAPLLRTLKATKFISNANGIYDQR